MPDNVFHCKLNYRHCEEILGLTMYYLLRPTSLDADTLQNLAEEIALYLASRHAHITAIMGTRDVFLSVEVTTPVDEDGNGPAGYTIPVCRRGTDAARDNKLTDMIAAQIVVSGTNELDEPVRNAKFWSCLAPTDVDCMELLPTPRTEIQTGFANFFEENLAMSSGDLDLAVKNYRAGADVITWHVFESLEVSFTLASLLQRRGDITPRRGRIVATP